MRDLRTALYLTIHGSSKSVEELADHLGCSASYLYKACEPDSRNRFPVEMLIPLMEATGDYSLLDHLNARCGRITASIPRMAKMKLKDPSVVTQIHQHFSGAMHDVLGFFSNPDRKAIPGICRKLHAHLCEVSSLMRAVKDFHQGEIF